MPDSLANAAARPRRSALYLPASNARAIEKARTLPCDVVILDLEDSVAPEAKIAARAPAGEGGRGGRLRPPGGPRPPAAPGRGGPGGGRAPQDGRPRRRRRLPPGAGRQGPA